MPDIDTDILPPPPRTREELQKWIADHLGITIPTRTHCHGHVSPLDYLSHAFFDYPGDPVVWASRGAGKSLYAAVATVLDLLYKPGVQIRILGGSRAQSRIMYEYVCDLLDRPALEHQTRIRRADRIVLHNESAVRILAQSHTSVRGQHVQKLRCDEVDLFDRDVWNAAQFVTKTRQCGDKRVPGNIEALSTAHNTYGLMHDLIESARAAGDEPGRRGFHLYTWCTMEVLSRCPPALPCEGCVIERTCRGAAKAFEGVLSVEDVLTMHGRVGRSVFDSEMLCGQPSRTGVVYADFKDELHVRAFAEDRNLQWVGGMDFGMRDPMVMLWAQLRKMNDGETRLEIVDEYVAGDIPLAQQMDAIEHRGWPMPRWVGVDPAGDQRQSIAGKSTITILEERNYRIRKARLGVREGVDRVRRQLDVRRDPNSGMAISGLLIHPRCQQLIRAMHEYHFDPKNRRNENPVKDGPDHVTDALRYLVINLKAGGDLIRAGY